MRSVLDTRIENAVNALAGAGGPMATVPIDVHGVSMPMIAAAPPNLSAYFQHFCTQHGDATFIVDGDERLSFAQVMDLANRVATSLVGGYGVQRGDRIGIAARNAPAWIVLYMGIIMAGGCATLLNGWWQSGELVDGIKLAEATIVFADPQRMKRINEAGRDSGARLIEIDVSLPIEQALAPVTSGPAGTLPQLQPDDLATILYTSGSTGQSKGAWSTHRQVIQGIFNYIVTTMAMLQLVTEDEGGPPTIPPATLLNVPLFHVTAEVPVMLQSFALGRKLVMMAKWDAAEAMRLIEKEKVTYFVGVPLMSFEILNHPDRDKYDLSSCTTYAAGGAPRPVEHVKRLNAEMKGASPILGYGLTETNAIGCGNLGENYLAKPASTGKASLPLVDLAILDDDGKPVPQGERGEICIRSVANFEGYWNNPEATKAAYTADRYFRTGDIGYLDEDDYLFIVDRKKDIIIRGGENIACQEVEDAIYRHPDVAEASVFGLPDERFGEVPGAVVFANAGKTVTQEGLQEYLCHEIAAFKVPVRIWIADASLPRLGTEKIDRVTLRGHYQAVWKSEGHR